MRSLFVLFAFLSPLVLPLSSLFFSPLFLSTRIFPNPLRTLSYLASLTAPLPLLPCLRSFFGFSPVVQVYGDFTDLDPAHEQVFIYRRRLDARSALIVLNFKAEPIDYRLPETFVQEGAGELELLVGSYEDVEAGEKLAPEEQGEEGKVVKLRAFEGKVYLY
jgi:hypothetical protein